MDTEMDRLLEILNTMDLPPQRIEKRDWHWCLRNIRIRNNQHPDIGEAIELLKKQCKRNVL